MMPHTQRLAHRALTPLLQASYTTEVAPIYLSLQNHPLYSLSFLLSYTSPSPSSSSC